MTEAVRTCTTCKGTSFLYLKGRPIGCPVCKGKGSLDPEPTALPAEAPSNFQIAIVGEAWGEEEARMGMPFVGWAGKELNLMLEEAEIERRECFVTSVFNLQPPAGLGKRKNDVSTLFTTRKISTVPMPGLNKSDYLQDQYFPEVQRLWRELATIRPNLVIALGNTALWALTGNTRIRSLRGTVYPSANPVGLKVLPTYHPAAVLRDWSLRSVVVADLMKARRQSRFPEIRRPAREIWIEPSLNHIQLFYDTYVRKAKKLAFDIETVPGQITCIGFAPSADKAIVIPLTDNRKPGGSYWPSPQEERKAIELVDLYLRHPGSEKVGQNTLYDINWLWHKYGLTPVNYCRDTMLKHHAMNPEMEKSLGFLGSIYTDEPAWKIMRGKGFGTKRGDE
jgi:uracil-DNA glycosylase